MRQRVTLADLSRRTGLSQSAISMILSRRQDVSFPPQTVKLVREAAAELGYDFTPRKGLSLFARRSIMVVCPYILHHYYSAAIQSLQSAAAAMQYNVFVHATYNDPAEEERILKVIAESEIGGIIFAAMPHSRNLLRKLERVMPVVIIADIENNLSCTFVELHNHLAGELLARHLAMLGHKRIACISTPLASSVPHRIKRYQGLASAWNNLCPDGSLELFSCFTSPARTRDNIQMERYLGQEMACAILEQRPDVTAIVALNDMLAYGAMDVFAARKIRIPEDYSICGCDNDFPSDLAGVNLTSIEHYMAQNAELAFQILYSQIAEDNEAILPRKQILPELVRRSSTAAPGKGIPANL